MILILIASVILIVSVCIIKKFFKDMSMFESDLLSSSIKDLEDISSSYEAIKKALENKQDE